MFRSVSLGIYFFTPHRESTTCANSFPMVSPFDWGLIEKQIDDGDPMEWPLRHSVKSTTSTTVPPWSGPNATPHKINDLDLPSPHDMAPTYWG